MGDDQRTSEVAEGGAAEDQQPGSDKPRNQKRNTKALYRMLARHREKATEIYDAHKDVQIAVIQRTEAGTWYIHCVGYPMAEQAISDDILEFVEERVNRRLSERVVPWTAKPLSRRPAARGQGQQITAFLEEALEAGLIAPVQLSALKESAAQYCSESPQQVGAICVFHQYRLQTALLLA